MNTSAVSALGALTLLMQAGLALGQSTWTNPLGGVWNDAANWDTATPPLGAGESAILPNLGMAYEVICDTGPTIDSLQINGPTQTLLVDSNRTLRIGTNAGVINEGLIRINDVSVFDSRLAFDPGLGVVPLAGAGSVRLEGAGSLGDARLVIDAGTQLALSQPLTGLGQVEGDGLLQLSAPITADVLDEDLAIKADTQMGPGGTMQGTLGSVAIHSTITGGNFLGGVEVALNGARIDGVTMTGTNGVRPNITCEIGAGGFVNNGTLVVNTEGSVFDAFLSSAAPCTINGNGTIDLNGAGTPNDARISTTAGNPITIGSDLTVSGNGRVRANDAPITFLGTALADRLDQDLTLEGTFDFMNTGTTQSAGGIVLFNNADVTTAIVSGDTDMNGASGSIIDCTNNSTLSLRDGSNVELVNALTNNGTFVINKVQSVFNAIVNVENNASITGTGTVRFQAVTEVGDARINANNTSTLTFGPGQTLEGSGLVDVKTDALAVIQGSVVGTHPTIDLRLQGTLDLTGSTLQGTTGFVNLDDADVTGGTAMGGVEFSGNSSVLGMINSGGLNVRSSSTLELLSDITNNSVLTINSVSVFDSIVNATLPVTFHGTGTIFLNGAGTPADAQLGTDQANGGSLNITSTQTVIGNGRIEGPATIAATLSPGIDDTTAGTIGLIDTIDLTSDAAVEIDFMQDINDVVTFDKFTLSSDLTLDGSITLRLQGGYVPELGDRFTIIDANSVTGLFASIDTPVIGTRLFRVIEGADDVEALWTCLGDVNLDAVLNPADFTAWINAFNSGEVETADQNMDGVISPADFTAWIVNFNAGC